MLSLTKSKKKFSSSFTANPFRIIVTSFAGLILIGTLLLSLPISSKSGLGLDLLSAVFTATSATCVTGLVVVDTFTQFTIFGQVIVLLLIQMGGLGLVAIATFFNLAIRKKIGLKSLYLAQESTSSDNTFNMRYLIKLIFTVTFLIELAGACVLATVFIPQLGVDGIFVSIFLAVSAYCNAGFDILGFQGEYSSLVNYQSNPVVLITIMLLIICGGLGFIVWQDLIHFRKRKRLTLHTKIVLIGSVFLIALGAVLVFALEHNNMRTLGGMTTGDKVLNSVFQSVTARTAGFNSFDNGTMFGTTKLVTVVLMFIGAAPGGTGGGIKVTTIYVLIMTVVCVMRGKGDAIVDKRKVDSAVVYKAMSVTAIAFLVVIISTATIFFTSHSGGINFSEIDALFESVSAFATVGLTNGVTGLANTASRIALILTMFIGRVGPVSLALSLALRPDDKSTVMPEAKIMVG